MALADGSNFGPYRIIGRLGRGGMATVYRAYEPGLDRYVALKVLPEDSLENETAVQRFKLEARAVARLVHPNIVPVHAFGIEEATRTPWMALQLIDGGSLAGALAQGRLAPRRAIGFLRGIASALDYAHGQGVLHRDVKPQNVLLAAGDHVYLADFGLARILESSAVLSAAGTVLGTPQYMAPEQALGQELDRRCDIYALGIVAYELLTGAPPFQADTPLAVLMKHVREPIPIPAAERVAEPLLRPVLKALAKDRDDRWATALSFVEALDGGVAPAQAEQPTLPVADPAPFRRPTAPPAATPQADPGRHTEPLTGQLAGPTEPAPADPTAVPAPPAPTRGPARHIRRRLRAPPELHQPEPTETDPRPPAPRSSRAVPVAFVAFGLAIAAGLAILLLRTREPPPAVVPTTTVAPTTLPAPATGRRAGEARTFDDGPYAWVPAGAFMMGCTPGDNECDSDESPRHRVTLTRGYYMARTEATVAQYRRSGRSMPRAPGFISQGKDHPIVNVTWNDADAYCKAIGGRLPTEAEWERAARGGHDEWRYPWGNSISHDNANYNGQSGKDQWVNTAPVGQFAPNDHGLVDMAGNVWEWTADSKRSYSSSEVTDPRDSGSVRVLRGGSWIDPPWKLRVSYRLLYGSGYRDVNCGFRCVRDALP